jgi:Ca-activated chloride channel homolog
MKITFFVGVLMCLPFIPLFSNGVCIVNADENNYLPLVSSDIDVTVNNQIATIKSTQVFYNDTGTDTLVKFAFPLTGTAAVIQLRWNNYGLWYVADFAPSPQDTILPGGNGGGSASDVLKEYLGENALYFNLEQHIPAGGFVTFEITYVDLLPYAFNVVEFFHPNDYSVFQSTPLDALTINFALFSDRTIDWVDLLNNDFEIITNNGNEAFLSLSLQDYYADEDLIIEYQLNAEELGLFSFSTFISDTILHCDEDGEGFMAFIVEPDPSENTQVIDKVFTLIIDKSGSMSGSKIQQARDAASFIVNHLNQGDEFNVVVFDSGITSFQNNHVPYNAGTQTAALNFIQNITSGGTTNISGAFSTAIPQFANSDPDKASIIIFFTDGAATEGITDTQGILDHVASLVTFYDVEDLSIFTFGIGAGANQQLLTLLALQNNGLSEFLGAEELWETITNFYLTIQNPVLLNTEMFFDPAVVYETYPTPLPNLFKGQQLIVVSRYQIPQEVNVNFSGTAFGNDVSYDYPIQLSDSSVLELHFLPRLWAKRKMENLYLQFFAAQPNSSEAMALEDSIINISLCYGVISPFTSFEDNSGGNPVETNEIYQYEEELISVSPNPFRDVTSIRFKLPLLNNLVENVHVEIWNSRGVLVQQFSVSAIGQEEKTIIWNGDSFSGSQVASGVYYIVIKAGASVLRTKVVKM